MAVAETKSFETVEVNSERPQRFPRPMPVVEDFYAKGWDFRARNNEEQVIVITRENESFETKLFRIGAALNLCAHLGYQPPTIVVEFGRLTDSAIPDTYRDIPELLQDIFPRLRYISVSDVDRFVRESFPEATVMRGEMLLNSTSEDAFKEFSQIVYQTVIVDGNWESWKYLDDYSKGMFEHLEFHPIIYHHCRKSYPQLFDRKKNTRGIFIDDVAKLDVAGLASFVKRRTADEKVLMFVPREIGSNVLASVFGENYQSYVSIVVGECHHVQMYLGVFCKEILIDDSQLGWWVGFHASYRGKVVYYQRSEKITLTHHCIHPSWLPNKN